jgi:hypothetical protein
MIKAKTVGAGCLVLLAAGFGTLAFWSWVETARQKPVPPQAPAAASLPVHVAGHVVSPEDRERYAGSASCVGCHQAEASQQRSRHARTVQPVTADVERARFATRAVVLDSKQQVRYQPAVRQGRCVLRAADASSEAEASADYAFGSGRRAVTYLGQSPGGSVQLRLSWYPGHGWDWTPGLLPGSPVAGRLGQALGKSGETRCFSCHSTALVQDKDGLKLGRSLLNVGCEACHGPGKEHVAAARRGEGDLRIARLSARRQEVALWVCAQCHSAPGQIDIRNPELKAQLPRFHGAALAMSRCVTEGKLTCVACHNPHRDADETPRAAYNGVCRSCHGSPRQEAAATRECPVRPRGDCVSCHMPAQGTGLPGARLFHNHWIKVWPASAAARTPDAKSGTGQR